MNFFLFKTDNEYIELEENIYYNFYQRTPDKWIIKNYEQTSENRSKPCFPYKNLICFGAKEDNKILAGSIFNLEKENLQLEMIGFKIPGWIKNKNYIEGILYFQNKCKYHPGYLMKNFNTYIINKLKNNNYEIILGSCYEKILKIYQMGNFEIIEEKIIDNSKEYFIYKNI
jgi:hypothetical protein